MKRGPLISLRRKPSLLLVILLRRLSRASSRYSTRISRSETIVFRSADSETLKWQPTLLVLKRWLVLAFVVSFIVLLGALFFASGEAYAQDASEPSSTPSEDSRGGGADNKAADNKEKAADNKAADDKEKAADNKEKAADNKAADNKEKAADNKEKAADNKEKA